MILHPPRPDCFLLTYFTGNGETGIYLAASPDGIHYHPLLSPNKPILVPKVGPDKLTRDACLLHVRGKGWFMVWTSGWWDTGIGFAASKDGIHWGPEQEIPVMAKFPTAINAWAPEVVYDAKTADFMIYWSSTLTDKFLNTAEPKGDLGKKGQPLNHRFYYTLTKDFKTFTPTKLLYDPGFCCIDATIHQDGHRWLLFGKNETKYPEPAKYLFLASAHAVSGPYTMMNSRITGNYWAEGPTSLKIGKNWIVLFDRYMEGRWGAIESTDLKHWTDISDAITIPNGARHGTTLPASPAFIEKLKKSLSQNGG